MDTLLKRPLLLALATSLLLLGAAPGLGGFAYAAWVGLVPLFFAISRLSPKRAAFTGFVTGLLYYCGLLSWILVVLGRYGNLPWWMSLPGLVLLAAYMAIYLALFAATCAWGVRSSIPLLVLAPSLWVVFDFVRSRLFSGFPWQDLAYSQYRVGWLIQLADLTGHYGVTFFVIAVNCIVFQMISLALPQSFSGSGVKARLAGRNIVVTGVALLLMAAAIFYSTQRVPEISSRIAEAPTFGVAVVQGNIEQDQKWTSAMQEKTVAVYTDLSRQILRESGENKPLIIWPETALPFYPSSSPLFYKLIDDFVRKDRVWLLTGIPYYEPPAPVLSYDAARESTGPSNVEGGYFNSVLLLSPSGRIDGRYDKQHLVPFGEYMPMRRYLPLPKALVESVGDFTPGRRREPLACQNSRIGVLICFESIFPELALDQVRKGANLLVNQTNDAWFGRSAAPEQHLSMVVFRAVETRRSLARAANTGISCFIDPLGQLSKASPLFTPYTGVALLPLLEEQTFFVAHGFWFVWLCFAVTVFACIAGMRERRRGRLE